MAEPDADRIPDARRRRRGRGRSDRRTTRLVALTAATTVLVILVAVASWRLFAGWRTGRIVLTNDGPPLRVEVLDESGEVPIGESFDVVSRSVLELPDGDYRLRVDGAGRLGRTYRLAVNRGETTAHALSLDEGRLLGRDQNPASWGTQGKPFEQPLPLAMMTRAFELTPGRCDLVEFDGKGLVRRDGATGEPAWDTSRPAISLDPDRDPRRWFKRINPNRWEFQLVEPRADVDGDGTRDVLAYVVNFSAFLAISGADGSVLWSHALAIDGPGDPPPPDPDLVGPIRLPARYVEVAGTPGIGDVDRDGVPDLVALFFFHETPAEVERRIGGKPNFRTPGLVRRLVQAISGRTGRRIWSHAVDPAFTTLNSYTHPPSIVNGRHATIVAVLDGAKWSVLDATSGRPVSGPFELGPVPITAPRYADLDGDGEPEILALGPSAAPKRLSLAAFSCTSGRPLWTAAIATASQQGNMGRDIEWPWPVDLDGDGRAEVIVPDAGLLPPRDSFRGVRMLDGATGRDRWVRPLQLQTAADYDPERFLVAPDLDGDGTRDLVVVSRSDGRNPPAQPNGRRSEPRRAYVDLLSGKDGRPLWNWHADLPAVRYTHIMPPRWFGRGPDGWPLLAVPIGGRDPDGPGGAGARGNFRPADVTLLEASTGREAGRCRGLERPGADDLDGDGLADLWGEVEGQLCAFRGELPEAWRALESLAPAWRPNSPLVSRIDQRVADLDGDGIGDTLSANLYLHGETPGDAADAETGTCTAIARSGRDGRLIWKAELDPPFFGIRRETGRGYTLFAVPAPAGDLDGDGVADVIVERHTMNESTPDSRPATLPIQVLSGRDGRWLWSAGPLPLGFEAHGFSNPAWVEPRAIEPGSPPDLLVLHRCPFLGASPTPIAANPWAWMQKRLARVSGRTGQVLWDVPLQDKPTGGIEPGGPRPPRIVDLDGDGVPEAVSLVQDPSQGTPVDPVLVVRSLRDGKPLWSRPVHFPSSGFDGLGSPSLEFGRRKDDGRALVFIEEKSVDADSHNAREQVHALDGRDGSVLWTWRSGQDIRGSFSFGFDPFDFDGNGRDSVCLTITDADNVPHLVILDNRGRERVRRTFPKEYVREMSIIPGYMLDLDGDGRDELAMGYDRKLNVLGRDMKERWSRPSRSWIIQQLLPASPGRPATLILDPMTAVDGATGKVIWQDRSTTWRRTILLDWGDASRRPLLISPAWTGNGSEPTVCRYVPPMAPDGAYDAKARGAPVPPGLARDDPRWTRALPWVDPIRQRIPPEQWLAAIALALGNAFVPLAILGLAARRRPWTLRLLMALPLAAAVPLTAFTVVRPHLPAEIASQPLSPRAVFVLGTLAGLPIVLFAWSVIAGVVRGRWKRLAWLLGLTIASAAVIAAAWLWTDSRAMPSIEHYGRSGWPLVLIPGAYAAGILLLLAWIFRRPYRWITRPRRPEVGAS